MSVLIAPFGADLNEAGAAFKILEKYPKPDALEQD